MLHCFISDMMVMMMMMMMMMMMLMMMMMMMMRMMPFLIEGNSRYSMCYMDFETIDFEDKFQDIEKASLKTQDT